MVSGIQTHISKAIVCIWLVFYWACWPIILNVHRILILYNIIIRLPQTRSLSWTWGRLVISKTVPCFDFWGVSMPAVWSFFRHRYMHYFYFVVYFVHIVYKIRRTYSKWQPTVLSDLVRGRTLLVCLM
jgi:hypothetical protein